MTPGEPHVTTPDDRPDVDFTADPAIWLVGPSPEASDDQRREWLLGAQHAVSTDFDLENAKGGADYRDYLSQVLKSFASWSTPANVTFLRMRHLGDTPVPLTLELYSRTDAEEIIADPSIDVPLVGDTPSDQLVSILLSDPDDVETVGEVSREPVAETGWQRLVYWVDEPGAGPKGLVRHVRHFDASGVVAVLRFGGLDPALTLEALADVDDLAATITVGGQA
jgi:hypothetical protein